MNIVFEVKEWITAQELHSDPNCSCCGQPGVRSLGLRSCTSSVRGS